MKKIYLFFFSLLSFFTFSQNGILDSTFGNGGKINTVAGTFNDTGSSIVIQNDGKILVAGKSYQTSKYIFTIIRYHTNGEIDTTFGNNGIAFVDFGTSGCVANSIALQTDGKIILGGDNNSDFAISRLNTDGSLDITFGTDGYVTTSFSNSSNYESINDLKMLNDGKILAVGSAFNSNFNFALAKYNTNGTLDTSFGVAGKVITAHPNGLNEYANDVALQNDGKIVVAGYISTGSTDDYQVIRYNSDGTLDTTFNFSGKVFTDFGTTQDVATSLRIQDDQKIVVGGSTSNGSTSSFSLARYNPDGSLDNSFDTDGKLTTDFESSSSSSHSMILTNNKIILAGSSKNNSNNINFALACYTSNGNLDINFGVDGKVTTDFDNKTDQAFDMALQTDGKIILAGNSFNDVFTSFALARYNDSATLQIQNSSKESFSLYPIPAGSFLNIINKNNLPIDTISIIDIFGKKVNNFKKDNNSLNVQTLQSGTYFLHISANKKDFIYKFIKD